MSGVRDQSGQHGKTLCLLKIQKLAGHGGAHLQSQLFGWLRQENHFNPGGRGCSEPDCVTTALQPGKQSKTPCQKKKIVQLKEEKKLREDRFAGVGCSG